MTTKAEEIAGEGPYRAIRVAGTDGTYMYRIDGPTEVAGMFTMFGAEGVCRQYNAAYTRGQQDRWIPVAMIHNDYDASVRCSNCGDTGGFGVYDDLEWAKHCPGCGRPISEQVSAKGVSTPHPLYSPPNPEQR